ncbi:MAG: pyridoxal-phosphate dependent enzyme [Gammaproteobacteria bacterium]
MTSNLRPACDVLDLIGDTPMVEVSKLDTGPCRLFLKMESLNPGGSIKDRIGLYMIEAAERDGLLKPGGTLIEATAGNTGLGLALVAAKKGYRLIIVIPDKMSQEKIFHLKAMGAQVELTRSDVGKGHPEYYQDKAERLASEIPGSVYINQFGNEANPAAHEQTTGPEIWAQLAEQLDAIVCGVGSGGTITGLSRFFGRVAPKLEMVLADPRGSILAQYVRTGELSDNVGSWLVEGIGEDFLPPICDLSRVKRAYSIPDAEAFEVCRTLLREEGIFAGTSSGTLIAAALRYCREQSEPRRVCTFVCDSGNKYLSKAYNDYWMIDQGFLERESFGDLRDIIARRHWDHATVTASPDDTLLAAYSRMKLYDVSQIPVTQADNANRIVGILDEEDVLIQVVEDEDRFNDPVSSAMSSKLETLTPDASFQDVMQVFDRGMVVIVQRGDDFLGLITRIDLLNYLRRRMR